MKRERTTALVLMDLWAFAYAQNKSPRTLREFESACLLAERLRLPEVRTYRLYIAKLVREAREIEENQTTERTGPPPVFV